MTDLFRAVRRRKLSHQRLEKESIMMYKTLQGMTLEYINQVLFFTTTTRPVHHSKRRPRFAGGHLKKRDIKEFNFDRSHIFLSYPFR